MSSYDSAGLIADGTVIDLNGTGWDSTDSVIDLNGPYSLLNYIGYDISVASDLDGRYDEIITIPLMGDEKAASILWVLITSGFFHRIRLKVHDYRVDPVTNEIYGQQFHVRLLEATMMNQGQLS